MNQDKKYTIFKTIFPNGFTHYSRRSEISNVSSYIIYVTSNAKTGATPGQYSDLIKSNILDDIGFEISGYNLGEDEAYYKIIELINNDYNSINIKSKIQKIIADRSDSHDIRIPKNEYIKHMGEYYLKSSYYTLNIKEYKNKVDLKKYITSPKNGVSYYRVKASYRVIIPGETAYDDYSQVI